MQHSVPWSRVSKKVPRKRGKQERHKQVEEKYVTHANSLYTGEKTRPNTTVASHETRFSLCRKILGLLRLVSAPAPASAELDSAPRQKACHTENKAFSPGFLCSSHNGIEAVRPPHHVLTFELQNLPNRLRSFPLLVSTYTRTDYLRLRRFEFKTHI